MTEGKETGSVSVSDLLGLAAESEVLVQMMIQVETMLDNPCYYAAYIWAYLTVLRLLCLLAQLFQSLPHLLLCLCLLAQGRRNASRSLASARSSAMALLGDVLRSACGRRRL